MLFLSHFSIGLVKFHYLWHTLMTVSIRLFMFLHFYALAWHYTVYIILHLFSIDNFEIKYCSYINIHQEIKKDRIPNILIANGVLSIVTPYPCFVCVVLYVPALIFVNVNSKCGLKSRSYRNRMS